MNCKHGNKLVLLTVVITLFLSTPAFADSITITASASPKKGGSISPSGRVAVEHGQDLQFTIKPRIDYQIKNVVVDGVSQGPVNIYTFTNITKKHSIRATFAKRTFTVTIAQGGNVTVSPVGTKKATYGQNIKLTIKPGTADTVPILLVDGQQGYLMKNGSVYEYVIGVIGDTSIYATSAVEPSLSDNTKVVDNATAQNLSSVSQDQSVLTFQQNTPYLQSLQPGSVIMSGVTDETPYGLLRKVTNVAVGPSGVTVETTEATLEDVIEEGEIIIEKALTANDIVSFVPFTEGVTLQMPEEGASSAPGAAQACFTLNSVLYDEDGDHSTKKDQVSVNGQACLSPTFRFAIGIGWFCKLKNLVFSVGVSESITLELDAQYSKTFSKEIPVGKVTFAPITVWPVVFVPVLTVYVGIDGQLSAGITARVTQNAGFTVGLSYHDKQWAPIKTFESSFDFSLPEHSADAQVRVYAGPEFDLLLYGVMGPYTKIEGYFDLEMSPLSNPWLSLYGGIEAGVGVKAKIFGKTLFNYEIDPVFDYSELLAQLAGNQPPTIISLTADPATVFTGKTSTVTVAASDPENDPLTCSWSTSGGTLSATTGCGSVTWTAPGTPGNYTVSVSVTDNKGGHSPVTKGVTLAVSPSPSSYTLTVQKSGTGSGTVTGTGINCGSDCSEAYASGTQVNLTATPNSGSTFTSWSGCDSPNGNACTVTMNQNKTVTATFTLSPPTNYTLTVSKSGTGSGTVTGTGINCGTDCSETYASGTQVTLTATPDSGSAFTSWSGCDSTYANNCTVTMNQNRTVIATFTLTGPNYTLTVQKTGSGTGTVTSYPSGIDCGMDCSETYSPGANVTLFATPTGYSTFTKWSGCDNVDGTFCGVIINQSRTVTVTFAAGLPTYTISGHITYCASSGPPEQGVNMNGFPGFPMTDAQGFYSVTVPAGWGGTVTPTKSGRNFNPPTRSYNNVNTNLTNQDYISGPC